MSVLIEKFHLETGDAVRDNAGDHGIVTRAPYTHREYGTVADVEFVQWLGKPHLLEYQVFPQFLTQTSGCECGNPFILCHPEA
ncbi:hypothetical protein [Spirillospora sp. CA-294931]|uniref:hypothetical protein n=1 Tax=Spirillospora sp. CA-294931 TaxID=3240042 RepID=UPI003D8A039C